MTAPTIGDVRRARPDALGHLATRVGGHAARLRAAASARATSGPGDTWTGPASSAAGGRHTELMVTARTVADGLDRCAAAIRAAGEQVADAQRTLDQAERAARAGGTHLLDSGALASTGSALPGSPDTAVVVARLAERARADYGAALFTLRE